MPATTLRIPSLCAQIVENVIYSFSEALAQTDYVESTVLIRFMGNSEHDNESKFI